MSHTKIANKLQNLKSSAIRELLKHSKMDGVISLGGGIPDPNLFDREGLQIAMDHILTHGWEDAFQYGLSEGNPELRAAICQIMLDRGIHCGVEDVVVTTGSQQSLDILARALINPGDVVVLERPTYLAALQVFQLAEANLLSVGTDAEGMIVDELETLLLSTRIKAVYIVPTFGNPTKIGLSLRCISFKKCVFAAIIEILTRSRYIIDKLTNNIPNTKKRCFVGFCTCSKIVTLWGKSVSFFIY